MTSPQRLWIGAMSWLSDLWTSLTLEPFIIMFLTGVGIVAGSEVQTNLMIWKVR